MKHLVLGAGPVGWSTMLALLRRGHDVTLVSRRARVGVPSGATHLTLDVFDAAALRRAADGADVVHQCLNAPYHRWAEQFPALQDAAVGVARVVGARLVSFENVYMYGAAGDGLVEGAPHRPCSKKGQVRAAMADALSRAHAAGALEVAHVRASDLFGPRVRASLLGDEVFERAARGLAPRAFGDLDAPHTWTFAPDAGETMARVGEDPAAFGRVWHVPSEAPRSVRAVVAALADALGRPLSPRKTPCWVLRLIGVARAEVGEVLEMLYQFEAPFVVRDALTRKRLGLRSTPFEAALAETVRWFSDPDVVAFPVPAPRAGAQA